MWSAVFDQTSCEFNAFLHVTSYMCHECYMKSQIITQADVFFLILYTTSVFVASVCGRPFSSMTILLRDLTLNLQPNDQEKCFSVLFCKPVSCCDNVVLIFWISWARKDTFLTETYILLYVTNWCQFHGWRLNTQMSNTDIFCLKRGSGGLGGRIWMASRVKQRVKIDVFWWYITYVNDAFLKPHQVVLCA